MTLLGGAVLLGPVALLGWFAAGSSASVAPREPPVEDVAMPPPAPKPPTPAVAPSSLMVVKLKDPRPAEAAGEGLRDAPHAFEEWRLTGTLDEIEERLKEERRVAAFKLNPRGRRAGANSLKAKLQKCVNQCRADWFNCGKARKGRDVCRDAYEDCSDACRATGT